MEPFDETAPGDTPADPSPGALSRLLRDMVASPERNVTDVWDRSLRVGATVSGRFELLREIGRGGFGLVFEARDLALRRRVAFKAIRRGPRAGNEAERALLFREAEAIALLQHPNIVTLFDVGKAGAGPFLILELLRGETLAARLARGPVPSADAVRIAADVARALVHAHARGVLHRDLKPSNVFLCADGPVKVLDFGLSHVFGARGPAGAGTPGYMAPEQQASGVEDERTDLHALGVVLREMVSGRPPGSGPPAGAAPVAAGASDAARGAGSPAAARVPGRVAAIADALASPLPAGRPPSAAAALALLERLAARRSRRRLSALVLAGVALAALGAVATRFFDRREDLSPGDPARRILIEPAPRGAAPGTVEAYRRLERAEQCANNAAFGKDCLEEFHRALALDPTLPAAHYGLAVYLRWYGGSAAEQKARIGEALRHAERMTPQEQLLVRAWAAHLDGRDGEALALFGEATARWPDHPRAFWESADILRHRDELALALPSLERLVALDPDSGWGTAYYVEALGALGREAELRAWVAAPGRGTGAARLHGLSLARGWLGDVAGAEEAARQAVGLGHGITAQQDLLAAGVFAGRYDEAERAFLPLAGPGSPVRRLGYFALAALDAYRGRFADGVVHLDELRRELPEVATDAVALSIRADYLAGGAGPAAVREAALAARAIDPRAAADHAVTLAWLGDLEGAAPFARDLAPGSIMADTHAALVRWHHGDRAGALAALEGVSARVPVSIWRVAPIFLLGDLAARAGDDARAIRALERFERLYLPRMMWRSWAHPRALVLLARAYERTGDRAAARARIGRLLAEWKDADPRDPLLLEARALAARLGAG